MVNKINLLDYLAHVGYNESVSIFTVDKEGIYEVYQGELKNMWNEVNPYYLKTFELKLVHSGV